MSSWGSLGWAAGRCGLSPGAVNPGGTKWLSRWLTVDLQRTCSSRPVYDTEDSRGVSELSESAQSRVSDTTQRHKAPEKRCRAILETHFSLQSSKWRPGLIREVWSLRKACYFLLLSNSSYSETVKYIKYLRRWNFS